MEAAEVSFRRVPCLSGGRYRPSYNTPTKDGIGPPQGVAFTAKKHRPRKLLVSGRNRVGGMGPTFSDDGHDAYYQSPSSRCRGALEKEKGKKSRNEAKELKKKINLVKGLARNLSNLPGTGLSVDADLSGDAQVLAEAAQDLLGRLQQLRAAEKEAKRRRKEEESGLCMKKSSSCSRMADCESSSSSSSESSDCEQAVNMARSRAASLFEPRPREEVAGSRGTALAGCGVVDRQCPQGVVEEAVGKAAIVGAGNCPGLCLGKGEPTAMAEEGPIRRGDVVKAAPESGGGCCQRIEVCMGSNCQKSGAAQLLQEFQKKVGVEGAVVGCKCMGKCKDGPNVRLRDPNRQSATRPPLCLSVGLEDVASIVSNFFVDDQDPAPLPA